ncbi:kinase-like domain-containing protein [Aspergillus similis]
MDSSSTVSCDFSSDSLSLSHSRSRSQSFSESLSSISPDSSPGTKLQLVERIIEPLDYYSTRRFHPVHLMDTFKGSRYRVIRKLGYGSFSTVWLARDTILGRYVALKVGQAEAQSSGAPIEETRIYQLLAESKFPSHSGRDHYLPLLDQFRYTGPNGTHQALVYEPMSASVTEVKEALFPNGPFPFQMAKAILWQTLLGLDFLLANGVVHGDVQPRNLLFTLGDLKDVPEDQLVQDKDKSVTLCLDTELKGGVKGPEYLVPAHSLMQYLDVSKPFTIKISDLGGSFLTSHPPSAPSPPLHLRGPETLFQRCISAKQDMWSFGCLVFEFITGVTLFDLSDHPVTGITDDMHFIDMYNILGFPEDETLRNQQWPNWQRFFTSNGEPIDHFIRRRDRDFDIAGRPTSHTLEELLEEAAGERLSSEEMKTTKHLLKGLLEFDLEKRFTTKDVLRHHWFVEQRGDICI